MLLLQSPLRPDVIAKKIVSTGGMGRCDENVGLLSLLDVVVMVKGPGTSSLWSGAPGCGDPLAL